MICPFGAIERPVATGVLVPDPNNNCRLAVGLAVLFPELAACQTKFCGTAAFPVLEYVLAPSCKAGELTPAARVAAVASRLAPARKVLAPFTSNMVAGVDVPMPTFVPDSKIIELSRVADPAHTGR